MPAELTRRHFIKQSAVGAAALAAATAIPAVHVRGAQSSTSEPLLRWGIIGTGTRGHKTHVLTLKEMAPQFELIALCDVAQSRASSAWESPRASRRSVTCEAIEAKSQPSSAWARRRRSRSNGSAGGRFARPFAVSSSDLILAIYHV